MDSTVVLQISIHWHRVIDNSYRDGIESLIGAVVDGCGSNN